MALFGWPRGTTGVDDGAGQDVGEPGARDRGRAREGKAVLSGAYYEQAPARCWRNAVVCRLHHSPAGYWCRSCSSCAKMLWKYGHLVDTVRPATFSMMKTQGWSSARAGAGRN